jgi:2-keto-3-deoxy-L-rhamnonate aldolase RhmA
MTFMTMKNPLRAKLAGSSPAYGIWVTLQDPTVTEIVAELGADWVCLEMEHGALDYRDLVAHSRAARGSGVAVLARLGATTVDSVKRALDLGVDGVMLPLPRSAEDVEQGFRFARYPARGVRGVGVERAVHWGLRLRDYLEAANRETLVIPIIETRQASEDIENILKVDGLEAIFFGPADLSSSCGHIGAWEGPGVAADILRMAGLAARRNVSVGALTTGEDDIRLRREQGFKMIGLGSDVGLMIGRLKPLLTTFKGAAYPEQGFV